MAGRTDISIYFSGIAGDRPDCQGKVQHPGPASKMDIDVISYGVPSDAAAGSLP